MDMTCDNDCIRAGWIEATATCGEYDLHFSHAPNADLEGCFDAFCHDDQEMVYVIGWNMGDYKAIA